MRLFRVERKPNHYHMQRLRMIKQTHKPKAAMLCVYFSAATVFYASNPGKVAYNGEVLNRHCVNEKNLSDPYHMWKYRAGKSVKPQKRGDK